MSTSLPSILIVYYSKYGSTRDMAVHIAQGVEAAGARAVIRTVPELSTVVQPAEPPIPDSGHLYCTMEDLAQCDGLALGSPSRFGNMAAPLKYFLDQTATIWLSGALQGKPASVFTSSGTMHGGQESTLITMMIPLLHHGMIVMGLPYALGELSSTQRGGTPYGASFVTGTRHDQVMSSDEIKLCVAQGKRLATLTKQLRST